MTLKAASTTALADDVTGQGLSDRRAPDRAPEQFLDFTMYFPWRQRLLRNGQHFDDCVRDAAWSCVNVASLVAGQP